MNPLIGVCSYHALWARRSLRILLLHADVVRFEVVRRRRPFLNVEGRGILPRGRARYKKKYGQQDGKTVDHGPFSEGNMIWHSGILATIKAAEG